MSGRATAWRRVVSVAFAGLLGCSGKSADGGADQQASTKPSTSGAKPAGGDGSTRESARELSFGETVTGKLPCEAGKQSIWWRIQAPAEGKTKLKLRTPKDGDQSCVHLNAYDASGKIRDTPNSTCSDQAANWAVFDDGPIKSDYVYLQLMSSMGTCFTSDFELTLSK